jgi:hypothetical protein
MQQPLKGTSLYSSHPLASTFQVGGFVVQNQVNCFRKILILAPVISCCRVVPSRRSADQKQEYLMEQNKIFKIILPLFLFTSEGKIPKLGETKN